MKTRMEIKDLNLTIRELAAGYEDNAELGVRAYSGQLDVRPPYQREFIYKDAKRDDVITTVTRGFPLNVMYWAVRDDGGYEIIDGQQRTISICQYVTGGFLWQGRFFHNLQEDEKNAILDYPLMVKTCNGTDSEKLDWFQTINIASAELTAQELRNAVYHGPWVTDAKRYLSKAGCPAYAIGGDYVAGSPIRQDYLETAIRWLNGGDITGYMAAHQHDASANPLWLYFQQVMTWVKTTFPVHRKEMKSVQWGPLYNEFGGTALDPAVLEKRVAELMADDEVTKKRGIYLYVLNGQERNLSLRSFTASQKREAYETQQGICPACGNHYELAEMEADHITPWHAGGKTIAANCTMLCKDDNRRKSGI
jgi:hypothetical protein